MPSIVETGTSSSCVGRWHCGDPGFAVHPTVSSKLLAQQQQSLSAASVKVTIRQIFPDLHGLLPEEKSVLYYIFLRRPFPFSSCMPIRISRQRCQIQSWCCSVQHRGYLLCIQRWIFPRPFLEALKWTT